MATSTFALFTIASFLWASDIDILVRRLNIVFIQTDGSMMDRIIRANASTAKIRYMDDVMFAIAVSAAHLLALSLKFTHVCQHST